jgi:hypothetical protein
MAGIIGRGATHTSFGIMLVTRRIASVCMSGGGCVMSNGSTSIARRGRGIAACFDTSAIACKRNCTTARALRSTGERASILGGLCITGRGSIGAPLTATARSATIARVSSATLSIRRAPRIGEGIARIRLGVGVIAEAPHMRSTRAGGSIRAVAVTGDTTTKASASRY